MRILRIDEIQFLLLELMKKVHVFMECNSLKYYLLGGSALGAVRHNGFIPWDDDIDIGMLREDYERFLKIADQFDRHYDVVNFKNNNNCDFGLTRIYIPVTYIDNPMIENTKLDKRLYFDIFPLDNVPDDQKELDRYESVIVNKKKLIQRIDVRDNHNSKGNLLAKKVLSCALSPFRTSIIASFDKLSQKYRSVETKRICSLSSQYSFEKQVMAKEVYGAPVLHAFETESFYVPEQTDIYLTILFGKNYGEVPPVEKRRKGHNIYLTKEE